MPLAIGTRLGPYEILASLGAGGMGEVYKAQDLRLNRFVAIKLLPSSAANDPERRERFEREALAVAALNHPSIVTIHSVEQADDRFFLTMELVEGRSLAEILPTAGLPLDRLLKIAIPLADAMATAHQKGITHRDLKPANIMIGEGEHEGRVKVLDFGLAKLADPPPALDLSALPTALDPAPAKPITGEGRILGTVAYMSPEQAEGKPIDARSDLFSLGVILYEMATGKRPFTGATNISIISAIVKDTPKPLTEIDARLPRDLERIVRRALIKDPERRYQTAKDLRNDLEELKASLDSGEPVSQAPSSSATVRRAGLITQRPIAMALVAVVSLALIGGIYALLRGRSAAEAPAVSGASFRDSQVVQLTTSGNAERPAISPDGKYVTYVQRDGNDFSLWIRQTTTTSNVQIVKSEPGVTLFGATVAPDGSFVDFVRQTSGRAPDVWRVPFLGGTPKILVGNVGTPIGWSPDGRQMAFVRSDSTATLTSLVVADADGSQEREIASRRLPALFQTVFVPWAPSIAPAWSPDGRIIAVGSVEPVGEGFTGRVVFVDVSSHSMQSLPIPNLAVRGLAWLDSRSLVVSGQSQAGGTVQLYRLSYPGGEVSRLTNDPNDYLGVSVAADRASLVTSRGERRADVWVGDGAAAKGIDVVKDVPQAVDPSVAWSGDRLVYSTYSSGRVLVSRIEPGGGTPEELITDAGSQAATSDGRTFVVVSFAASDLGSVWAVDGNGRRVVQLAPSSTGQQPVITPDDQSVIYSSLAGGAISLWMVPIGGGAATRIANGLAPDVSPDGRSIVFLALETTGASIVVCDFPKCTSRRNVPDVVSEMDRRRWTPDGRGIAYAARGNIWVQPLDGKPSYQLTHFTDGRPIGAFAWSHDGKRLAIARQTIDNDIVLFKGLRPAS